MSKKKIKYFYVVDEDGDQRTLPTLNYKEAIKDLIEIRKHSSGFHIYSIEEYEVEEDE